MQQNLNYPVQMFCVMSTQGDVRPVKFKYEDPEHQIITVYVNEIHSHKEMTIGKGGSILFICGSELNEQNILYELRYEVGTHKWILSRRLC